MSIGVKWGCYITVLRITILVAQPQLFAPTDPFDIAQDNYLTEFYQPLKVTT